MNARTYTVLFFSLFSIFKLSAQSPSAPESFEIYCEIIGGNTTMMMDSMMTTSQEMNYNLIAVMKLTDTLDVDSIYLKVTNTSNIEIINKSYEYEVLPIINYPDGTMYSRIGNILRFELGSYFIDDFTAEVQIKNSGGSVSPVKVYVKN